MLTFYVHPADFGLPKAAPEALKGGDAATNAEIVRGVLAGRPAPARDVVLLNAGAGLFVAGGADTVREGIARAAAAIDSGAARGRARDAGGRVEPEGGGQAMSAGTPDLLEAIVAAARARVRRVGVARARARCVERAALASAGRRRRRFIGALDAPRPREHHRRVQAPVAVAGRPARGV